MISILKSHRGHPLAQRDGSAYKKMHADVAAWHIMIVQFEGGKTVLQLLIAILYNEVSLFFTVISVPQGHSMSGWKL